MSERIPLLVLGLGNVLLEDDGVGSAAVALLDDHYTAPEGVRVLDGGTLGLSLLPYLEEADAVDSRRRHQGRRSAGRTRPPGRRRRGAGRGDAALAASGGRGGPARWRAMARIAIRSTSSSSDSCRNPWSWLSGSRRSVRPALPALVERVVEEARTLGFVFRRKDVDHATRAGRIAAVDDADVVGLREC